MDARKYSVTNASEKQRWWTNWSNLDLVLDVKQRTVRGRLELPISQPITAYVSHLCWQLSLATLAAASGTTVVSTMNKGRFPLVC